MSLSVLKALNGRTIFLTGTTGFVGKVLLEKILRDVPDVGRIFILIRGKAVERFEKEILESPIFTRLRSERPNFEEFARGKVVPMAGDVLMENLGLSPNDLQLLNNECNFVVHCAASVDFKERLDNAIKKNVMGTLQLFEMSKKFRNLKGFIHVSTCYVNANAQGFHKEELPNINCDPDEMVNQCMAMDPEELVKATPRIIGSYPNTYTFTKALAERLLEKRKGNTPLAIVRPSIVGCAWKEPFPGWLDSVSAVAAVVLYAGVGIVRFVEGDPYITADVIPVDTVCNIILAVIPAVMTSNKLNIYHVGSSSVNPIKWIELSRWVSLYWRQHNVKRRVDKRPVYFKLHKQWFVYRGRFFLQHEVPAALYSAYANSIGTQAQKKNAQLWKKINDSTLMVTDTFRHFTTYEFVFDVANTENAVRNLVPEERAKFEYGLQDLDWEKYSRFFGYGVQRFIIKEEVKPPTELLKIDLIQNPKRPEGANTLLSKIFPDLAWSYKAYKTNAGIDSLMTMRTPEETKSMIVKSKKIQEVIKQVADAEKSTPAVVEARAVKILDRMAHNLQLPVIRAFSYFMRKVWRRIYDGIHVDEKGLENVRKVLNKGPIVLIPTHRSYVDFLLVSYVFFEYGMPIPHIASGEDFLAVMFVNWIFRNSGAFFLRRSFKGDNLYTALFTEYVQRLVCDWSPIEFFIEGKRSRSGKSLHPKYGLLSICVDPFFNKKVPDVTVVPISISYEKVIEAELYSNELLGEKKTKESFQGLIRASKILKMNFGRIHLVFNDPISVKDYTASFEQQMKSIKPNFNPFTEVEHKKELVNELAYKVVYDLNQGLVLTASALVATVILGYRKGITAQDLVQKVNWLRDEIYAKGASVAHEGTTEDLVERALKLLDGLVENVRGIYVTGTGEGILKNKPVIVLDFYRNQLVHLFVGEAIVAAILSGSFVTKDGIISRDDLVKECQFLNKLLQGEFVNKPHSGYQEDFPVIIESMIKNGIIAYTSKDNANPSITITPEGEGPITFLSHMIWGLIDSYWVSALSLFSLQPNLPSKRKLLLQKTSWLAEKMHDEGKITFLESCSMEYLSNALDLFNDWKVVDYKEVKVQQTRKSKGNVQPVSIDDLLVSLNPPYQKESVLQEFVEKISKFRKTPAVVFNASIGLRKAVMADFPMLAKL